MTLARPVLPQSTSYIFESRHNQPQQVVVWVGF